MCRNANLGVCCAQGCDARIRCQDTGGYCDAHDPYDFVFVDDDEPDPEPREPNPPDDPDKRRAYDLVQTRRSLANKRLAVQTMERDIDRLVERERQLVQEGEHRA